MVQVDGYTVALVRADTKQPFLEHTAPDGKVYAEVEPGVEYFICVSTPRGGLFVKPKVDGAEIGHSLKYKSPAAGHYIGSRERKDGVSTTTALRFNLVSRYKSEGTATMPENNNNMLTGKVKVEFYELGEKFYVTRHDYDAPKLVANPNASGKKCVMSRNGSVVLGKKVKPKGSVKTCYKRGAHLCTVTLYYCTATGLIANNILGAPPAPAPVANEVQSFTSGVPPAAGKEVQHSTSGGKVKLENAKTRIKSEKDRKRSREEDATKDEDDEEGVAVVLQEKKANTVIDLTGD